MRPVLAKATPAAARLLWQMLGAALAGVLPALALNLKVASREHRLAAVTHTAESMALAVAGAAHVALLARCWEARAAGFAAPAVGALWAATAGLAAGGLPVLQAGETVAPTRREE